MNSDSSPWKFNKRNLFKNFCVLVVSTFIFSSFSNPVFSTSDGLVVDLDAANSSSYSGSGSTWTNLVGPTNFTISNGSFDNSGVKSIVFNGTSTFVEIGSPIPNNSNFTKEAWAYSEASSSDGGRNIISSFANVLYTYSNNLAGGFYSPSSAYAQTSFSARNSWQHIVLTFNDSTNTMTLYVNGVLQNQNTGVNLSYVNAIERIGAHGSADGIPVSFWKGKIAKVKVYTTALTTSQVVSSFNADATYFGATPISRSITYDANKNQHQTGETTGSVPSISTSNSGSLVTVSSNSGSISRKGFSFAGWNTASNGTGTTYTPGTGTFTLNNDTTLYAKWEIPESARLISSGSGSVITVTGHSSVTNGTNCTGGLRGITTDGTFIYYRSSSNTNYICKAKLDGTLVLARLVSNLNTLIPLVDSKDLTYSSNCIFIRKDGTGSDKLYCIDISDWSITEITQPGGKNLLAGTFWLTANLIDFPDGRIGAVSGNNQTLPLGTAAGQCPSGMYCKILRLYTISGSGKSSTLTFSEDIILADTESDWPDDDHGIATDGTYLYQSRFNSGYKVWALESSKPSYLVFNGSGSGTCLASTGVSGTLCKINEPINPGTTSLTNATYFGRSHANNQYLMGDYAANRFYLSNSVTPPAGPGSSPIPNTPTINSVTPGTSQLIVSFTAGATSGTTVTNYQYSTDGVNYFSFDPPSLTSPLTITTLSTDGNTSLTNGTIYPITIRAVNSAGVSSPSNSISASPVGSSGGSSGSGGSGGSSSPSATPTPTPSPTISNTNNQNTRNRPGNNPNNLLNNPLANPNNPFNFPQAQPGSPNAPRPLVPQIIQNLIQSLQPIIVNLFGPNGSQIPGNQNNLNTPNNQNNNSSNQAANDFTNQQALDLLNNTQDKKVVELPSLVLYNNEFQPSKLVIVENTIAQVVSPGGGLLNLEAKDGQDSVPVDNRGRVQMVRSNNVETEGTGMQPNSEFAVYLFSDPMLLGIGKTDAQGRFFASFPVTQDLPIGDHTLQVNGLLPDGRTTSISLPVIVVDTIATANNQAMPKTILIDNNPVEAATNTLYFFIAVLIALIIFMSFGGSRLLFAAFRRRKDDDENVQPAL